MFIPTPVAVRPGGHVVVRRESRRVVRDGGSYFATRSISLTPAGTEKLQTPALVERPARRSASHVYRPGSFRRTFVPAWSAGSDTRMRPL